MLKPLPNSLAFKANNLKLSRGLFVFAFFSCFVLNPGQTEAQVPLRAQLYQSGFSSPLFLTSPPGDYQRLFVVEQTGRIRIIENGYIQPDTFFNIAGKISCCGERGLLGLAFHPNYASNGYFYVSYTNPSGNSVLARYSVSPNPDTASSDTGRVILTVTQPFSNHNGGWIGFGPDGYLYMALGDGGSAGDPQNNGQKHNTRLGKMLRIDVDTSAGFKVPPDNPFVGDTTFLPEIWAYGLRNPWRPSFDRATGDLYIADVGQGAWEEVNFQPASSPGGENYGWVIKEGDHCYPPLSTACDTFTTLTDPIHEYSHSLGCSISGGYVYRGCAIPSLVGSYFFGDYCSGRVWSFKYDGVDTTEFKDRTTAMGTSGINISSFGEDAAGELYIAGIGNGNIYKIVPDNGSDSCSICLAMPGDADASLSLSLADIIATLNYIFSRAGFPDCSFHNPFCWLREMICRGDWDGNQMVNLTDAVRGINYLFNKPNGPWNPVATDFCCLPPSP